MGPTCVCFLGDGSPFHSASSLPTTTGSVHKPRAVRLVLIWIQFNKCDVVYATVLHRGHGDDVYVSALILFRYERSMGSSFVLPWARVRRGALGSVVTVGTTLGGVVFVIML